MVRKPEEKRKSIPSKRNSFGQKQKRSISKSPNPSATKSAGKKSSGGKKRRTVEMRVGPKTFLVSTKLLKEIKYYQTVTTHLIPKLPFSKLVREVMENESSGKRIQRLALEALQESSEDYLVHFFEDSYICTLHARRSTLIPRDMDIVRRLRY